MANIYLDHASTTPLREEVACVMTENLQKFFGNSSSLHRSGRLGRSAIEMARKSISSLLNTDSSEIIFTSGGTEANNMILTTAQRSLKIKRIITSPLEHKSVLESAGQLAQFQHTLLEFVALKPNGVIDLEDLENRLKTSSVETLVSLMHANNEIGNILPLLEVSKICKKYNAWFHTDMIQTIGHYRLDVPRSGVDFASCSAHKFCGPLGAGFAFIRKNSISEGFIVGGPQERGLRAGTENIYGITGMAKALECALEKLEKERKHIESIKEYAVFSIRKALPQVRFNGLSADFDRSLYTILNISLPVEDDLLSFYMDLKGISLSQGSACLSGSTKPSHVIQAISNAKNVRKKTSLRISFGYSNTKEHVDRLIAVLKTYLQEHKIQKK